MTLQSSKQHITREQLSAPSESLSTLVSIHEWRKSQQKTKKAGSTRKSAYLIMLSSFSILLPLPALPLCEKDISEHLQICTSVPGVQETCMPNGHLPISCASLAASKHMAAILTEWPNYAFLVASTLVISCLSESCQCLYQLYERLKRDPVDGRVSLTTRLLREKEPRSTLVKLMLKMTP